MYGLGTTLRCVAGLKNGSKEDMEASIGPALAELVTTLLELNSERRPTLEVALLVSLKSFFC
jgi:hypothetical protein